MSFQEVFELIGNALSEEGVAYLLIGGHAVNCHGYVRATQDVDFMIATADVSAVRSALKAVGYSNISEGENVVFFERPESPLRVDFLPIDGETMDTLLSRAESTEYAGCTMLIPGLRDLLAMKLFAWAFGSAKRGTRDRDDIVQLVRVNGLDAERDLKSLCLQYATDAAWQELSQLLEEGNA